MMRKKKEEESQKTIKFKWHKVNDVKALQEAIDGMKFKTKHLVKKNFGVLCIKC